MKMLIKGIITALFVLYPFIVGWSLSHGQFVWVSALLIGLGVLRLFSKGNHLLWPLTSLAIVCGGLSLLLQDHAWLKLYPVGMSLGALGIFAFTLIKPPSMIERFARLIEPDLPPSGVHWTRQVTKVWCVFFLCNALIALITVFFTSTQIWVIYNGFISYVLMGMLFLGEFILRKRHQRLHSSNH
ncbi:septation protein IspZ [Acinetobacter seifertii]|uniref:Septation protein IspZ n=1 Tax=Acinetobacter seifertii TaxID=1530123 RepID=A0A7H2PZX0_9GAMM|nr:septation protein IspZ [Acinetobacter seifertii]QNX08403.1 septation protein IspZ [Acinetobacter seifertii]QNX48478.1 septation protein IspZ [Acinetobacter seifertii]QNX87122.1 septation protein IspZ [Acinetobacter seifertii]QNY16970.1 septation protein IspZ [Acinetobacter seifertii]